jgi:hypothetical protein
VLARPHDVIVAPDTGLTIGRDTTFTRTLVVIGGPTRVAARVQGDLVVLGDLFLRPGAVIDGRALAFGGGAYNSALASVGGGVRAFPDVAFDPSRDPATGAITLAFRQLDADPLRRLSLPGLAGFRIPSYTRIDGIVAGWGPEIALLDGGLRIEPVVTYRSHLGVVDPSVRATIIMGRRTSVEATAARGTFTNDAWMRGDLVNAAVTLAGGGDARNYYRADRGELIASRLFEAAALELTPFVGALAERSWAVARDSTATSRPFSVFGRDNRLEGMLRPNPGATGGRIVSALAGLRVRGESEDLTGTAALRAEVPASAPAGARFVQLTADGSVAFAAFGDHRVAAFVHAVVTAGDDAPSQRFAYLGGGPTLPSIPLLSVGGDQLLWAETRYTIPVRAISLPFAGSPSLTLRHMIGSAGQRRLPAFVQNLGIRLSVGPVRLDYTFDPRGVGDRDFTVGIGLR